MQASVSFAKSLGVSDLIIGLTIVAAGTSMPELATSITATIKGERGVAAERARPARCRRSDMTAPIVQQLRETATALSEVRVSMRTLAQARGPAAHGSLLPLMAVPCPLPVPDVGTVLGLGMARPRCGESAPAHAFLGRWPNSSFRATGLSGCWACSHLPMPWPDASPEPG